MDSTLCVMTYVRAAPAVDDSRHTFIFGQTLNGEDLRPDGTRKLKSDGPPSRRSGLCKKRVTRYRPSIWYFPFLDIWFLHIFSVEGLGLALAQGYGIYRYGILSGLAPHQEDVGSPLAVFLASCISALLSRSGAAGWETAPRNPASAAGTCLAGRARSARPRVGPRWPRRPRPPTPPRGR